jgi:hypothetical protein
VDAAATRSPRAGEAGAINPASAPPPTESRSPDDHRMYLSFDRADLIAWNADLTCMPYRMQS